MDPRARVAVAVLSCLPLLVAGCGSSPSPKPSVSSVPPPFELEQLRSRLLTPPQVGPGWVDPAAKLDLGHLPALCASTKATTTEPGPDTGDAKVAAASASKDQGPPAGKQPQFLAQYALVFPSNQEAAAYRDRMRAAADACPEGVFVPRSSVSGGGHTAAYDENVRVGDRNQGAWAGFEVLRHQQFEPGQTASGDIAIAVLLSRNAVIVVHYATWLYGALLPTDAFTAQWQQFVDRVTTVAAATSVQS
jgi:hypothetical protein